jgi:hypothetical protein
MAKEEASGAPVLVEDGVLVGALDGQGYEARLVFPGFHGFIMNCLARVASCEVYGSQRPGVGWPIFRLRRMWVLRHNRASPDPSLDQREGLNRLRREAGQP